MQNYFRLNYLAFFIISLFPLLLISGPFLSDLFCVILGILFIKYIIKNDKLFFKDKKFSRTEYEKFLIKSGITAPQFEANIVEQEKRRQFLSSLAGGIVIPETLISQEFKKENQTKTIQYIDLDKYHTKNKPSQESMKELYERNKNVFFIELKSIRYAEIKPELISGSKEYNENFFKQLDVIENNILDGLSFEETTKANNLKVIEFSKINDSLLLVSNLNVGCQRNFEDFCINFFLLIKNTSSWFDYS